uniref:Cadherin domain-containing protein n=1 Tax=Echinostoma caproni TaxID=27848 RepID=A0A183BC82_9TREM
LVVLVTDSKLPPVFTATTTVSIEVLDENDNAPIFINPPADPIVNAGSSRGRKTSKSFTVMENAPRFTRLSEQLEARDPDQVCACALPVPLCKVHFFWTPKQIQGQVSRVLLFYLSVFKIYIYIYYKSEVRLWAKQITVQ